MTVIARARLQRTIEIVLVTVGLSAALTAGVALAVWSASGGGAAGAAALTAPGGNAPTASVSGTDVLVSWSAATFPNGGGATGYVLQRYDATTGAAQSIGANCAGTLTTTSCTEHNVPVGSWTYTDTPLVDNWTGSESAQSNAVRITPPPLHPIPTTTTTGTTTTTPVTTTTTSTGTTTSAATTTTSTTTDTTTTDASTTTDQATTTDAGTTTDTATTSTAATTTATGTTTTGSTTTTTP